MAQPRTRIPLNVFLNGRLVGRLRRQASGAIDFQYDDGWLGWEQAFPVSLSLPLREAGLSAIPSLPCSTICCRITSKSAAGWRSG